MNALIKAVSVKHLAIGLCMLASAGVALALKPTERIADGGPRIDLEVLIPKQFGDWTISETIATLLVDPGLQAKLDRAYSQTLARIYVNSRGERIMLSIAYGGDQSDAMSMHKPEVCYPAQGFQILRNTTGTFATGAGEIPVRRLVARQGQRVEPITYWMTIGDTVAIKGLKWKFSQIQYGLTGKIPDGLLFRISSIQADERAAFRRQDDFARSLIGALTPKGRQRIFGISGQAG